MNYREDDDYALRMTRAGRLYRRFAELDPGDESLFDGTPKPTSFADATAASTSKWGAEYPVNLRRCAGYETNKELMW
jgi:hypothetical protein